MNTREQLNQYLRGLETRLRWMVVSKGFAIGAGVALGVTLAMVLITNALAFSSNSLLVARFVLFLALAIAIGLGLVLPLLRLNRGRAARRAESTFPQFEERLLTFVERDKAETRDPMLELLAADTAAVAHQTEPARVAPPRSIFAFVTSGGLLGAVLIWLIMAGPGYFGYGASLLWAGIPKGASGAFYDIIIDPGNKLVRRKADQMVMATLTGFQAPQVKLYARYRSTSKWEEAPMLPRSSGSAYEFLFAALAEPVDYYVEAAGIRSKTYKLDVVDLAGIKKVKVTYRYPAWLNLPSVTEDPGGDLRAVSGTIAELTVETDRPLKNGTIEIDDGSHIALEPGANNILTAKVPINKDGMYHFAANEQGQSVRLSEDYFIEAREDQAPSVKITHPGSDAKVSPIEEVQVQVAAEDDFALESMELHYSVNGTAEKVVSLLPQKGVKTANGMTTLYLEDYKLEPGDVVAVYATARDARTTSRTDILFVETQPFERNYTQSQQGGGGGGGGGGDQDETRISQRQKEIIAATWNEIRGGNKDRVNSEANAKFLAEIQQKLKEQATSLAQRMRSRELAGANQEFQSFVKDMDEAAAQMTPAADKLKTLSWKDALEPEQKALQHLLRAEATFRDIQVAFGNRGGMGGGGGGAGRDLANLFDLELDTEKNQYETGQQGGSSNSEQRQKEIDEALQKLEQLARRQQELAEQQRNGKQTFEQRWQQEMLRRDAEELKKQMEQLSREGQQGSQSNSQSSSQSSSSQSGSQSSSSQSGSQSSSQSGSQSGQQGKPQNNAQPQTRPQMSRLNNANDQRLQQSLERLKQAQDDMRSAQAASQSGQTSGQSGGGQSGANAEANARRAAERLKEAQDILNGFRKQEASSQLGGLSQRADDLAAHQRDFSNRLRQAFGDQINGMNPGAGGPQAAQARQKAAQSLADEKDKMAADVDQLEKDMQKAARDMSGTQPAATGRVREGLSELQQNEAKLRMQYSARNIRQGMGGYMVPREAPITETMDRVAEDLKAAQNALGQGGKQATNDAERSLAQLEQMRGQMEQMAGRGQPGTQPGGNQPGNQNGNQPGGNQQGNQQGNQAGNQAGGNQGGYQRGGQVGGPLGSRNPNGGGQWGNQYYNGRFAPEGIYEPGNPHGFDPQRAIQAATHELNEMRQMFKDNPELAQQFADVEREISRLAVGDISSAELQNRLNREVLPNLESLEVQLRRQVEKQDGDQVRSGSTDKVPTGYADAVADYFRKLSKGKP
jgi:hypothetical protein